ncbi:MAG: N-acetylmuramoyl-L-alanine amidase [Peptococcaceae bacterium]|nr:N-acetylmuramoyl-L-alanine amidase [Peptococcaceae bacterium]
MPYERRMPYSFSAVLLLAVFLGVLLGYPGLTAAAGETAVVAADVLNVRTGPGTGYGIVTQVGLGERLPVLDRSGDWYKVQLSRGGSGWVAGWLVKIEAAASSQSQPASRGGGQAGGKVAVVTGSYVNVRSGPGTGYGIVTQVGLGERLPVLDKSGDWYKVQLSAGNSGWIAGWLVNVEDTAPSYLPKPGQAPPADSGGGGAGSKVALVTGSVVNVRSGPGTSNTVVGQVSQGDSLPVLEQSGDWYRVKLASGGTGWVAGWLVSVQPPSPEQTQPSQQPGPPAGEVSRGGGRSPENQSGKVVSLAVNEAGGRTSTVIEADRPFDYASFSLSNPDRLVVDLKGVAVGELPATTDVNTRTVKQVRAGYYQKDPDITRIVFDLKDGVQYVASLSRDQRTLTVETYIPDINGSYAGKVIAIDPGHGGPDPGAIGGKGTKEKDVTLDIAKRAARLLESRGARVIMTRSGDWDIGLYERTDKANNAKADIFVSIHINAHPDPAIGGTTTYIYSGNGDPGQAVRIKESARLARNIQAELVKALGLRDIGVKDANFAVLRTSNMPAVLAELAFISNPSEEKYMNTDAFRNGAAEALVKGIGLYLSEKRTASSSSKI